MKRLLAIIALVAALTLGTGGNALAHTIEVTNPHGTVVTKHDLATGTPRIFDADGNHVGPGGTNSAASQGTNVACEAVGTDGPVRIYGGPVCKRP